MASSVENRWVALRFVRSPRATRAPRATNPRPSGLVALGLAESHQSYVRKASCVALHSAESRQSYTRRSRYWQNDIDTAGCCCRVIHAAGESGATNSPR